MILGCVKDYISSGWEVPFPLPEGKKYPPVTGVTGRIGKVKPDVVKSKWDNASDNANLGLRMQVKGNFDVIAIDVDHYASKQGRTFLNELMEELGDLNLDEIPRSTRRGMQSQSAQYFFKVPKGKEWESKACADVDIVQATHRYSAVWPSVVDGEQYKWYIGDQEAEIPHVKDLPTLPDRWVNHLSRGKKGRFTSGRKAIGGYRGAMNWLRDNLKGWEVELDERDPDPDAIMSPYMREASTSDAFLEDLETNAHDTMVSAVHSCIMLATEGHHGLKLALYHIEKAFTSVVIEDGRRDADTAQNEYYNSVVGEVEKLAAEVESGTVRIVNVGPEKAIPNFFQLLLPSEAEKRPLGVDWRIYGNTDQGHAKMFRDYWDRDVLVTDDNRNQEFAAWMAKTGRYTFRNTNQMFQFIEFAVSSPLDYEADKMDDTAQALKEKANVEQLAEDEIDPEELEDMAKFLRSRANSMRNTRPAQSMLKQLHSFDDISTNLDNFDTIPGIIGTKNAKTLDLNLLREGKNPLRDSVRSDMLTMSTSVSVQPNSTHPKWEEFLDKFLPDPEIRRFTQKVFGYTLVDHNPAKLLVFLWGDSNTGKSTMLEAVARALGDYAVPMSANKIFGNSQNATNPELVSAIKKKMIILSEVGDGYRLSSNAIKQITGNDLQQARNNHSNHIVNAVPQFTPYVSTNNPPEISRGDSALKNRILALPFEEVHPPERILPEDDLKENKEISSAILWWIIEGCKMYLEEGLMRETWPQRVIDHSRNFVSGTSVTQRFLEDRIQQNPQGKVLDSELFRVWKAWCIKENIDGKDVGTKSDLLTMMESNGFQVVRKTSYEGKKNQTVVKGLQLQD